MIDYIYMHIYVYFRNYTNNLHVISCLIFPISFDVNRFYNNILFTCEGCEGHGPAQVTQLKSFKLNFSSILFDLKATALNTTITKHSSSEDER